MDTAQINGILTFLSAAGQALEHTTLVCFLFVVGYCLIIYGVAHLFTILRVVSSLARDGTAFMLRKLRLFLDELAKWPPSIRDALRPTQSSTPETHTDAATCGKGLTLL
jgi:hypothetical protein